MKIKKLMIVLIIFLFVMIPASSAITREEMVFYDSIKEISEVENKSDFAEKLLIENEDLGVDEIKKFCKDKSNSISTEISMLNDLYSGLSDQTYMEYVDLQINRLENENKSYTALLGYADTYALYEDGQLNASDAFDKLDDYSRDVYYYGLKSDEYQSDIQTFLSTRMYMKNKFNKFKVDNDFLGSQEGVDLSESLN